jgi:hypothetical protein
MARLAEVGQPSGVNEREYSPLYAIREAGPRCCSTATPGSAPPPRSRRPAGGLQPRQGAPPW